jgi:expansin (peptidoglycan-binding protein)
VTSTRRAAATVAALVLIGATLSACQILPGTTYTGEGTYYDGDGSGNCGYPAGPDVLYAAMNQEDYESSRACGAYIRATGPDGVVTVRIVDRCPECAPGDVDFSPEAFDLIANPVDGRVPISWELVSGPAGLGNVQYVVKDGANPWWFAIQPRRHRNLVTSLEVDVAGSWVPLERLEYNYFVAPSGLGAGPFRIRLTDVHGEQLIHSGITLSPTVVQTTGSQFAAH